MIENIVVREQVGSLFVHCRFGVRLSDLLGEYEIDSNGCPFTIKLAERRFVASLYNESTTNYNL